MERKTLASFEIKNADLGEISAVIATFDVVDHDGDVVLKGAMRDGAHVALSAYNHASWQPGALPVGRGVIRTTGSQAVFDGKFFMDTTAGKDTFNTVKQMGDLQQYSWGYDATDHTSGERDGKRVRLLKAVDVHEVSPVLRGASIGTQTLGVKSLKYADEATAVVTALAALIERTEDVMTLRAKEGKGLGDSSRSLLADVQTHLKALSLLLADTPSDDGAMQREYLRFMAASSQLREFA